ncbi:MAG TPA: glycosyltransferase family 4 protein, partial [Bacteroidia bacterium]
DGIYPYVIGGMQKHSFNLVNYFTLNGVEVDLYHSVPGNGSVSESSLFSDEQKRLIHEIRVPWPGTGLMPGHYLRESYRYSITVFENYMKRPPVDFTYIKGFSGWKLLEEKKQGRVGGIMGVNFHGYEMFQPSIGLRSKLSAILFRGAVRYNISAADYVFSYGANITSIIEGLGISRSRIIEIPTGIERGWLEKDKVSTHEKRRFIFVGRNERRKGIRELMHAVKMLDKAGPFTLDMVGPVGPKRIKNVIYHGEIREERELRKLLGECDVLVCPSHSEGMPNVIMEAMACGLAVIGTDVGAVPVMVDEKNGILLKPGKARDLAAAMEKFIYMPMPELNEMKRSSLNKVASCFLWEYIIAETIKKLDVVITQNG